MLHKHRPFKHVPWSPHPPSQTVEFVTFFVEFDCREILDTTSRCTTSPASPPSQASPLHPAAHSQEPEGWHVPCPLPGLFKWTNYDSTGGEVSLSGCLPAYYIFLPFFAEFVQNFVRKCRIFWKYTEFRQVSLLFVRYVRKAPNRGLDGSLLPLTRRKTFQTLNEKHIPCTACPAN